MGSIPGSKRSSGGGDGNPFQYCPWTEEPGGLQSMGSHRVGHDRSNLACKHAHTHQEPGTVSGTEDIQEGIQPPKSCPQGTHIIMSNFSSNFSWLLLCEVTEPPGNKCQYTEDREALKQKETHLNECERLKAPKQFTFSGKGFPTSNSLSLLSRANVHRGKKKKKKKNRKIEIKLIHTVQITAPIAS